MALRHKDVISGRVRENEYEHVRQHILDSQAIGDLVIAQTATQLGRLAIGSDNYILSVATNTPAWISPSTLLADISPLTTRGDIMYRNATISTRLAKGADNTILAMGANDPEWKTPATIMADLSGQAGAAFAWNSQNLTGVGTINTHTIPGGTDTFVLLNATQELDNKTLDSSVLKGTFTASGTVILAATTFSGDITMSSAHINLEGSNLNTVQTIKGIDSALGLGIQGQTLVTDATERPVVFYVLNEATNTFLEVFRCNPNGANPTLKLSRSLELNGQILDAGSGDMKVRTTGSSGGFDLRSTNDTAYGPAELFFHVSTTPTANNELYRARYFGRNSTPGDFEYGRATVILVNATASSEESKREWFVAVGGALNLSMTLSGAGALWTDASMDTLLYKVSGTQVVSAQGAAVANPTDAASTQARLIDLLGRLRTHGLIAT